MSDCPYLFVGLGNPGVEYSLTRHNIGYLCVDSIAKNYNFPPFQAKKNGAFAKSTIHKHDVILFKPTTYMNNSGLPVHEVSAYYDIPPEHIFVFHDDLDLAPGKIKVKYGGGNAGHNGLKDLDHHLSPNYWRVRIGIGRPPGIAQSTTNYVLGRLSQHDQEWVASMLHEIAFHVDLLFDADPQKFAAQIMQDLHQKS